MAATDKRDDDLGDRQGAKVDRDAEDREEEADQQVDRDLGRGGRQEGGHPRRRIGIGIRQPDVEREQRELQADADGHEGQGRDDRARVVGPGRPEAGGDVDHVEAAGEEIEQADADDVEGRADRAHDQILEGGEQRAPVAAERDQHVGRQRRDFEKHEGVEGVAGDRDAQQPGEAQQVHAVEPGLLPLVDLEGDERRANGMITAPTAETSTSTKAFRNRPGTRCPRAAPSRRGGRRSGRSPAPATALRPAMNGMIQLTTSASAKAALPRRKNPASNAPSSGTTTCNTGRCGQTAFISRGPFRRSRPPRSCRKPR